jgi:Ni/Fe-hydrogenase 1 B-type cytochrome subunit
MTAIGERIGAQRTVGHPARALYVWEWPVRIVHWVIVLSLVVLSVTGYYLDRTFLPGTGSTGDPGFLMGQTRFIHEVTGYVFTAAVLVRIYWALRGNRFAHWRALLPITAAQLRDLRDMIRYYALVRRHPPRANGHNPLAALVYLVVYALFLLSVLTGFSLYAWAGRIPAFVTAFGWTYRLMPIQDIRLVHFLLMYVFAAFTIHHVYSAVLIDLEERNGELSSIVTGYKADLLAGETPRDEPGPERR